MKFIMYALKQLDYSVDLCFSTLINRVLVCYNYKQ